MFKSGYVRGLLWVGLAVAVTAAVWRGGREAPPVAKQGDPLPARAVLAINPKTSPPAASAPIPGVVRAASPDLEQLEQGRDLAGLYERLRRGQKTAESLLIQAEIYNRCSSRQGNPRPSAAQRREKFVAALLPADPAAKDKLAAFDRLNTDSCAGLENLGQFSPETMRQLLIEAKDAGSARAAAWMLAQEIEARYHAAQRNPDTPRPQGQVVSDADFAAAVRLLETRDPEVVRDLQGVLSSTIDRGTLLINGQPIEPRAMHSAISLVACDLGAVCDASSRELLSHCAYRGECGTANLQDYTFFYLASPAQAQRIDQYRRDLLGMFQRGDFSGLTVARGVPNSSVYVFGGRRKAAA